MPTSVIRSRGIHASHSHAKAEDTSPSRKVPRQVSNHWGGYGSVPQPPSIPRPSKVRPHGGRGGEENVGVGARRTLWRFENDDNDRHRSKSPRPTSAPPQFSTIAATYSGRPGAIEEQKRTWVGSKKGLQKRMHSNQNNSRYKDPEGMYEEIQRLKLKLNDLSKEKNSVIGKLRVAELDNKKLETKCDDLLNTSSMVNGLYGGPKSEEQSVRTLKRTIKEHERRILEQEKMIANLRRDFKHTRMMEMEVELKTYYQEIIRLRREVEQIEEEAKTTNEETERRAESQPLIRELESKLNDALSQNERVRDIAKTLKQQNGRLSDENERLEKKQQELEPQMRSLQMALNGMVAKSTAETKENRQQQEKKENELNELRQKVSGLNEEIEASQRRHLQAINASEAESRASMDHLRKQETELTKSLNEIRQDLDHARKSATDLQSQLERAQTLYSASHLRTLALEFEAREERHAREQVHREMESLERQLAACRNELGDAIAAQATVIERATTVVTAQSVTADVRQNTVKENAATIDIQAAARDQQVRDQETLAHNVEGCADDLLQRLREQGMAKSVSLKELVRQHSLENLPKNANDNHSRTEEQTAITIKIAVQMEGQQTEEIARPVEGGKRQEESVVKRDNEHEENGNSSSLEKIQPVDLSKVHPIDKPQSAFTSGEYPLEDITQADGSYEEDPFEDTEVPPLHDTDIPSMLLIPPIDTEQKR